jgi:hypothetical protein
MAQLIRHKTGRQIRKVDKRKNLRRHTKEDTVMQTDINKGIDTHGKMQIDKRYYTKLQKTNMDG